MIPLPKSLVITRNPEAEAELMAHTRKWVEGAERTPGIHASDLLDPRKAYWNRKNKQPFTDGTILTFFIGKILHSFILSATENKIGVDWASDTGSKTSELLGIDYSVDSMYGGLPREVKTSRKPFLRENDLLEELRNYIEQLVIYLVAEGKTTGSLWILFTGLKGPDGKTQPTYHVYDITITESSSKILATKMIGIREALEKALKTNDPSALPLCREWLCKRSFCAHYDVCKPEERWAPEEPKAKRKKKSSGSRTKKRKDAGTSETSASPS